MSTDQSHISPVWARITDLVVERGEGCYVVATNGNKYLDFSSGIGVANTGHCHPKIVQAIQEQASKIIHSQVNCYFHPALVRLTETLNEVTPRNLDTFFFSNSGAEAVEGAVKLAKHYTERPNVIVFQGGFHGRTAMTMAMTTGKSIYRVNYQPLPGGVFVAPFPYAFRYVMSDSEVSEWALRELDLILHTQSAPEETAAMVIEPVLGEGGYIPAPVEFLQGLRKVCDDHNILLIMDEVQSGFGRTGKFFDHQHAEIDTDIMVMAKGIASGFPISGIASTNEIMEKWQVGAHGGTYGGNPMGCAAAVATINVIRDEGLVENAAARGNQLMERLRTLQRRFPVLADVRGRGLMIGCEFTQPETGEPDVETTQKVVQHALENGHLILLTCGAYSNVVRWIPPLIVSEAQIDEGVGIFEKAMATAS